MSRQYLSISGISKVLVTQFWPNFKGSFLGPYLTDANCHGDICLGNKYVLATYIHIRIISAVTDPIFTKLLRPNFFQQNLSCYWPAINQTFGTQFLGGLIIVVQHFTTTSFDPNIFGTKNSLYPKFLQIFFWPNTFGLNYLTKTFFLQIVLDLTFFQHEQKQ